MSGNPDPSGMDGVPAEASDPAKTPFDYIIVGSGAGGAPLAARLAQAGKRVLVLEAGVDPGADPALESSSEELTAAENERAIFHCPGFHAAASEPERYNTTSEGDRMSWHFAARHLSDELQKDDPKAEAYDGRKVFYPRCSSIGGCTSHNTMVSDLRERFRLATDRRPDRRSLLESKPDALLLQAPGAKARYTDSDSPGSAR
jgi:glycine/D-amino acid oxidase-like deaminating enzyme